MIKITITPNNFPEIVKKELARIEEIAHKCLKEINQQIKRDFDNSMKLIEAGDDGEGERQMSHLYPPLYADTGVMANTLCIEIVPEDINDDKL